MSKSIKFLRDSSGKHYKLTGEQPKDFPGVLWVVVLEDGSENVMPIQQVQACTEVDAQDVPENLHSVFGIKAAPKPKPKTNAWDEWTVHMAAGLDPITAWAASAPDKKKKQPVQRGGVQSASCAFVAGVMLFVAGALSALLLTG